MIPRWSATGEWGIKPDPKGAWVWWEDVAKPIEDYDRLANERDRLYRALVKATGGHGEATAALEREA